MSDPNLEARAAAAAAYVLHARAVPRDLGGRQTRDFDLILPDGSTEPLEVTVAADQSTRQTWARLSQLNRAAPSLKRAWTLSVPNSILDASGATVPFAARDFLAAAEPGLAALERAGVTEFNSTTWFRAHTVRPAVQTLISLGCDFGLSGEVAAGEGARIYVAAGVGGWVSPDLVAEAVEREAAKADNQAKLSEPPAAQHRHLFVVIDPSTGATFSAASHGDIGRLPVLPPPITTVWAAASTSVHSTTPPQSWKRHELPEDVFDSPQRWIDPA